jgi:hypothetical protein
MGVADKVQCAYGGLDGLALLRATLSCASDKSEGGIRLGCHASCLPPGVPAPALARLDGTEKPRLLGAISSEDHG